MGRGKQKLLPTSAFGQHRVHLISLANASMLIKMSTAGDFRDVRMARIRFDFGALKLDAELLDTPTAKAIAAALPISSAVLTWGEEVYFDVPVDVARA